MFAELPNADRTSFPKEDSSVAEPSRSCWLPGVGGAERLVAELVNVPGSDPVSGGDFVDRGEEFGVERGEAWWFCQDKSVHQVTGMKMVTSIPLIGRAFLSSSFLGDYYVG